MPITFANDNKSEFSLEYPEKVRANTLVNVRSGPATTFAKVGTLEGNQVADCYGKINNWFLVHLDDNTIGMVSGDFITPYYTADKPKQEGEVKSETATRAATPTPSPSPASITMATPIPTPTKTPDPIIKLTEQEQEMVNLINKDRLANGLQPLMVDAALTNTARIKSRDMVNNSYFSHESKTYGSPFDMLAKFNIDYRYAGENIAANKDVQSAYDALYASEGHRENMLSPKYQKVGVGIVESPLYGIMITQLFTGN